MASPIGKGLFRAIILSSILILLTFSGCGDDGKVSHIMTVNGSQTVSICFAQVLVSTATIWPANAGIPMKYTVTHDPSVTISGLASLTGTVNTNASGQANLAFTAVVDATGTGTISVKWEFADTSDGTGSGTQTFTSGGC